MLEALLLPLPKRLAFPLFFLDLLDRSPMVTRVGHVGLLSLQQLRHLHPQGLGEFGEDAQARILASRF